MPGSPGAGPAAAPADVVLVVDHQLPTPDRDSGSLRLTRMIEQLTALDRQVLFFPSDGRAEPRYADRLRRQGVAVLVDQEQQVRFLRDQGHRIGLALLCRPQPALRLLGEIRDLAAHCTVVYDTVDLHFRRLGGQAALAERDGRTDRFRLRAQAETVRALELLLVRESEVTLVVSAEERAHLESLVPGADVRVLSNIHAPVVAGAAPAEGARVLFVGHYQHAPNADAARWLAREIMPLVRREVPEAVLDLVGSSAPEEVTSLAGEGVVVPGWVPDLGPVYARARVAVAPLRFGAGVKGKVGEALEHQVPVVGTTLAFEGMGLEHDCHVLMADTAEDLAAHLVRVLRDDALHGSLVRRAVPRLRDRFGPEEARRTLLGLLAEAGRARR
ncbi:glycosyl transferase [Streptomyces lincolnensis]|uniref:Glycosyl transferase n=1 Tax=Streptomyces lincolnensis TaxID=1915 RepID=A0A1B1MHF2_STRLN|nr:glycosyltransferase family 4 protein [Streptomyces lincolnensis]ANS68066.1 glycosyl transferase [Streptomyces lincolnensis]AXG53728.1 glycosyl transferase [Streptomyces lincolnensis]QMV09715.1 glycosyltransferase [Streptomyces lincolnensis]